MFNDFPTSWRQRAAGPAQAGGFEFPEAPYDDEATHAETLRHLEELYSSSTGEERARLRKLFREQALFRGDMTEAEFDEKYPDEQAQRDGFDFQTALFDAVLGRDPASRAYEEMQGVGQTQNPSEIAYQRMQAIGQLPDFAGVHPLLLMAYLRQQGF